MYGRVQLKVHPFDGRARGVLHSYFLASAYHSSAIERVIDRCHLPDSFDEEALEETARIKETFSLSDKPGYRDLSALPLITIDGADSRDFDDAVHVARTQEGGFTVHVAIADVSHYVKEDSALDRTALLRGNSVYFPGRVLPMLPERLSNDLCSLVPNEPRFALVCKMEVDAEGVLQDYCFFPALMRSVSRQTYDNIADFVEKKLDAEAISLPKAAVESVWALDELTKARLKQRAIRGGLRLEIKEREFVLNEDGRLEAVRFRGRRVSALMIEEAMILANIATGKFLEAHYPHGAVYRVHPPIQNERYGDLKRNFAHFGAPSKCFPPSIEKARDLEKLVKWIKSQSEGDNAFFSIMLIRNMSRAVYQSKRESHFGLACTHYSHFTSPIRRYADLIAHRLIKATIKTPGYTHTNTLPKALSALCALCTRLEHRAQEADYVLADELKCAFMESKKGESMLGIVTTLHGMGLFVMLPDSGFDGLLPFRSFDAGYRIAQDENTIHLADGRKLHVGSHVEVSLDEVDFARSRLTFSLMDVND